MDHIWAICWRPYAFNWPKFLQALRILIKPWDWNKTTTWDCDIRYNFNSYALPCFALHHDLLLYEPLASLCYHLAQHLCHVSHSKSFFWLNFLMYFGRHFHFFFSMNCIKIFHSLSLIYWCWIWSFVFFRFFAVHFSDICNVLFHFFR